MIRGESKGLCLRGLGLGRGADRHRRDWRGCSGTARCGAGTVRSTPKSRGSSLPEHRDHNPPGSARCVAIPGWFGGNNRRVRTEKITQSPDLQVICLTNSWCVWCWRIEAGGGTLLLCVPLHTHTHTSHVRSDALTHRSEPSSVWGLGSTLYLAVGSGSVASRMQ